MMQRNRWTAVCNCSSYSHVNYKVHVSADEKTDNSRKFKESLYTYTPFVHLQYARACVFVHARMYAGVSVCVSLHVLCVFVAHVNELCDVFNWLQSCALTWFEISLKNYAPAVEETGKTEAFCVCFKLILKWEPVTLPNTLDLFSSFLIKHSEKNSWHLHWSLRDIELFYSTTKMYFIRLPEFICTFSALWRCGWIELATSSQLL